MDKSTGERDLFRHPCRVVNNQRAARLRQAQSVEQLMSSVGDHHAIHAAQQTRVADELQPGELVEKPKPVRQDADQLLRMDRVGPDIKPEDVSASRVRPQEPGRHGQGGGRDGNKTSRPRMPIRATWGQLTSTVTPSERSRTSMPSGPNVRTCDR